jgi:galactose mutarotase-like enzyme
LLVTCGLEHFGPPEKDEFGERGVHGLISNTPAEIESIIQPDPVAGKMDMSITGIIKQTQIFGPSFELRRTLSGTLGKSSIRIHDEVVNRGNVPTPHMLLYHFNFGWPLIDEGTEIIWSGKWQPAKSDSRIFKEGENFRTCRAPMEAHNAGGEDVVFIDIDADAAGMCAGGLYNRKLDLGVIIRFPKKQLPWLNNWQHFGKGEYVVGVEPATNPVIGQSKSRAQNQLILLAPGQTLSYDVELNVVTGHDHSLNELLKK